MLGELYRTGGSWSPLYCQFERGLANRMNTAASDVVDTRGIVEFISDARWTHALFTTYALSLSYFESELLRPLLHQGCDDIWLVCDAEGYRSSLLERRSVRVGHEYRIVPVALPHGVFHPKAIYLVSHDEQLLLVGSGNVTFGGHGRNTEVFEALVPRKHATAFADFAEFLEQLATRPEIMIARRDWLDDFAERARTAASAGADESQPPVRLVHPLERTATEQLGEATDAFDYCGHLRIISPYHDPDGAAVKRLINRLGPEKATVAVTNESSSQFPFEAAAAWSTAVESQRAALPGNRFVHAKWIECECGGATVLLTGSFNSTSKALTTTENVELGVLRVISGSDPMLHWEACDPPPHEPAERHPAGLGHAAIVYASFDRLEPPRLVGHLISLNEVAGEWACRIVHPDGLSYAGIVFVEDGGEFCLADSKLEEFSELSALQIVLQRGERSARGWIHNELLLNLGMRRRLSVSAMARLMRREGTDDDLQALLDYLSISAARHYRVFVRPIASQSADTSFMSGAAPETIRVNIEDLAPTEEVDEAAEGVGSAYSRADQQFDLALVRLRRTLLGHGLSRKELAHHGVGSIALAEEDEPGAHSGVPEELEETLGLREFEDAVAAMLTENLEYPDHVAGLLTVQLEVGMWMRLHRLASIDRALEFLAGWLRRAAELFTVANQELSALTQHFVTGVAIYSALATEDEQGQARVALHDDVEKFFGGSVSSEILSKALIVDPHQGFAASLCDDREDLDLQRALEQVLVTRTRRQQLIAALQRRIAGEPAPVEWEIFQTKTGKALHAALHRPRWEMRVKNAKANFEACPHCFTEYGMQEKVVFRSERIGQCIQCNRFGVNITP
jgi:hypothetical protein